MLFRYRAPVLQLPECSRISYRTRPKAVWPPDDIMNDCVWYYVIASLALVKLKKRRQRKGSSTGHAVTSKSIS